MYVAPLREIILVIGGIKTLVSVHFLIACGFCAFVFVHVNLATLGHTPLAYFKPMWDGWEKVEHADGDSHGDALGSSHNKAPDKDHAVKSAASIGAA
jgi:hypothetical protein